MGLIEVAGLIHRVEDRSALLEERRRLLRALNLPYVALAQSGSLQEPMAQCAGRHLLLASLKRVAHHGIACQRLIAYEPFDKRFDIVKGGELPCRTMQPEGLSRHFGQDSFSIQQVSYRHMGHKRTKGKLDPQQFDALGVGDNASRGQWPDGK